MSIDKESLVNALAVKLPIDIVNQMVQDYLDIKHKFILKQFRPSELNAARFGESIVRLIQHLNTGNHTPLGANLGSSDSILNAISNNTSQTDAFRYLVPRLTRVLLDVRNKRDVAHVGGEVSPNYSDSLFLSHAADWIMCEVVRHFYSCSPDEARRIVIRINEVRIPVVTEIDGFLRVQNTSLDTRSKVLVILYYKQPAKVSDADLKKWIEYGNISRFRSTILTDLHKQALIHFFDGRCQLLDKGTLYVEKNISLDLLV